VVYRVAWDDGRESACNGGCDVPCSCICIDSRYVGVAQAVIIDADEWYQYAIDAEEEIAILRAALELIASPMRPDGTWNRDREACRQLAEKVLRDDVAK